MKLLNLQQIGQSDLFVVSAQDQTGKVYNLSFSYNPTDEQIVAAILAQQPRRLIGTSKATIEPVLEEAYQDWQRWKNTHTEAVARALPAIQITALLNKTDAAWTAYATILNQWRQAPA